MGLRGARAFAVWGSEADWLAVRARGESLETLAMGLGDVG